MLVNKAIKKKMEEWVSSPPSRGFELILMRRARALMDPKMVFAGAPDSSKSSSERDTPTDELRVFRSPLSLVFSPFPRKKREG